jgi:NAD/NADP transhydrogenase alpha subunit
MSIALIIGLGVLALIVAIAVSQRSGPRITRIEIRREREDEEDGK